MAKSIDFVSLLKRVGIALVKLYIKKRENYGLQNESRQWVNTVKKYKLLDLCIECLERVN